MNKLEVKYVDINLIKPYENNPRNNDNAVEFVANSIKEFGFKQPIVVDKDNIIIVGHTRYKASLKLGLKEVPITVADDLSEEKVKAFRIADNSTHDKSEWDPELLEYELADIIDIDMTTLGVDIQNLDIEEPEELEQGDSINNEFIVKIKFDSYKDWKDKENEFRKLVENSNANIIVGSV